MCLWRTKLSVLSVVLSINHCAGVTITHTHQKHSLPSSFFFPTLSSSFQQHLLFSIFFSIFHFIPPPLFPLFPFNVPSNQILSPFLSFSNTQRPFHSHLSFSSPFPFHNKQLVVQRADRHELCVRCCDGGANTKPVTAARARLEGVGHIMAHRRVRLGLVGELASPHNPSKYLIFSPCASRKPALVQVPRHVACAGVRASARRSSRPSPRRRPCLGSRVRAPAASHVASVWVCGCGPVGVCQATYGTG